MKIIHCADIHLGAKITNFSKEISEKKKNEVLSTFSNLVRFAKREGVRAVLIAGDLFDREIPFQKDRKEFLSIVKNNPELDFLYLRGNHDLTEQTETLENLKYFSSEWTQYSYGDLSVAGIELNSENETSAYSTLSLDENKKNLVVLHGQVGDGSGKISLSKLRSKYIDYLALGHIHSFEDGVLDDRGRYAYSGCLEGRGFDETGKKGFVLLEIEEKISYRFIPYCQSVINEIFVEVSGVSTAYEAAEKVRETGLSKDEIYRVILTGELDARIGLLKESVEGYLKEDCAFIRVKDETKKRIAVEEYEADTSIRGEFVRLVHASEELSEEDKATILNLGLSALKGGEVEV